MVVLRLLVYCSYDDWNQDLILGVSLAAVYLVPLIGQAHIAVQCDGDIEEFCKIPSRFAMAYHGRNDTERKDNWDSIFNDRPPCRRQTMLAYIIPTLVIVLASNVSLPLVQCYRRLKKI